ncbi:MAG TPA: rhomboid family intramembrane serine protease [Flavitalea sp.]|nr:rhomboid family intramembrane serine protease [Flavitalea sp.]
MLRENRYKRTLMLGQDGNTLVFLMMVLAVVFCIFKFIYVAYRLSGFSEESFMVSIFNWFCLPADTGAILQKPWTIITYMFIHHGVWHFLGNMLWLWAFGYILQDLTGNRKLIPIFLYGGLAGALLYVISFNVFPFFAPAVPVSTLHGASAGVMAVAIATTTLAPGYRIFPMIHGGIPLWILTIIFVVIDFASIPGANGGGSIAHLGGATIGFIFMKQLNQGRDWSNWMNQFADWATNLFNPEKKEWKKTAKKEHFYNTRGAQPYKKIPNVTQKRIDEILDKINQKGYRYLSEEEKEILKRASQDEDL